MSTIAANLKKRGAKEWELNVRTDNERAIHLYERFGMRANHSTHVLRLEWSLVPRLDPPTRTPRTAAVEPKHDAGIEAAFDLPTGQLARLRSFSGHVLVQLLNELDEPVAVARFDPEFPGSFPFRMLEPELARPLLEAIRPHARPKPDWLQIVIENDAACAELLRENGARLVFEILHMRGKIP
jgi:hypothetical protein